MSKKLLATLLLIPALTLGVAACGSDDSSSDSSGTTDTATEMPADQNIVQVASESADLTTLVDALVAADLVSTLEGTGPFTVFAPTNEAFEALPEGTLDSLLADPTGALADVLKLHVISGEVDAAAATEAAGTCVETLGGQVKVEATDTGLSFGGANIVETDIMGSNGIIHVLDAVVAEPSADC